MLPAPAQGALAVQCRAADRDLRALLSALDHAPTRRAVARRAGGAARARRRLLGAGRRGGDRAMATTVTLTAGVFAVDRHARDPRREPRRRSRRGRRRPRPAAARAGRRRHPRGVRSAGPPRRRRRPRRRGHELSHPSRPPPAPHTGAAGAGAGNPAGPGAAGRAALRPHRARRCASRSRSMPATRGCRPISPPREAAALAALGVGAVLLFGIPRRKDAGGTAAWDPRRPGAATPSRASREAAPALSIWADVCLCEYTDHGHCGVLDDGVVDNDATLPLLARAAVAYAVAGADVIAPSDMMDGRVGAIRAALDAAGCAADRHRLLRRQVRVGVLRAVPRSRRLDAAARRSARLPDGSAQRPRGRPRSRWPTSTRAPTW